MKYEIVELEEKVVIGIKVKTTNQDGKAIQFMIKYQVD